jgi:hypothetical protein
MSQMQRKAFHFILYLLLETRGLKRKRCKQWVDFMCLKQAKWGPTLNSCICSAHFANEDFTDIFSTHSGKRLRLATDEIGIIAIPKYTNTADDKPLSVRAKRMVFTGCPRKSLHCLISCKVKTVKAITLK